jgi:preprotein translocase subunit SecG
MIDSLMIFQVVVSILLIAVVLLQFGKGAEVGLLQGTGDSVLSGSQKGNIMNKITVVLSILFLGNSILLARIQSSKSTKSILDDEAPVTRPLNDDAPAAATPAAPKADTTTTTTTEKK